MPIKGLTDRGLAFPEIGQIRKGIKEKIVKNGREIEVPKDLWYFRVVFAQTAQDAAEQFRAIYGMEPTRIKVMLPFDEIDRCWEAWLEAYTAGRMIARSDGEYVHYLVGSNGEIEVLNGLDQSGEKVHHPIDNIAGHDYQGKPVEYDAVGRLRVILPELQRAAYLLVNTTSKHDIINISAQLKAISELNDGRVRGVPLILARTPKEISTPLSGGRRARRVKHLLSIEADPAWVRQKLSQMRSLSMPDYPMLGAPPIENGDTAGGDPPEEIVEAETKEVDTLPEIKEPERPYPPDVLRTVMAGWVDARNGNPTDLRHRNFLRQTLLTCCDGEEPVSERLLYELMEAENVGDLTDAEVNAMLVDWLGIGDWDGRPVDAAIEEIKLILDGPVLTPTLEEGEQPETGDNNNP